MQREKKGGRRRKKGGESGGREREREKIGNEEEKQAEVEGGTEREEKEAAYIWERQCCPSRAHAPIFPRLSPTFLLQPPPSTIIISPSLPDGPPFFFSLSLQYSTTVTEIYPAMRDRETRGLHACRCMWDAHAPW